MMGEKKVLVRWLGTSGFEIDCGERLLVDPFLTRNRKARPVQNLSPVNFEAAKYLFLSHGHFDHAADVPSIHAASGCRVFCSSVSAKALKRRGVSASAIRASDSEEELSFGSFSAKTIPGEHSRVDAGIIIQSLPGLLGVLPRLAVEQFTMKAGPLLIFLFSFSGIRVLHMGSLPLGYMELARRLRGVVDVALIPLRGRSDIHALAAEMVRALEPPLVIPQHHDDFLPPISPPVNLEGFRERVRKSSPGTRIYEPAMNEFFSLVDVL